MERYVGGQAVPRPAREIQGLLRVPGGPRVISLPDGHDRQVGQDVGCAPVVPLLPKRPQRLLEGRDRPVEVVQLQRGEPRHPQRVRFRARVPDLPGEFDALLGERHQPLVVRGAVHAAHQAPEGPGAYPRREAVAGQRLLHQQPSLGVPGAHHPVHAERPADAGGGGRVVRLQRPADGGPQVIVFGLQTVEPLDLIPPLDSRLRGFGERQVERGVAPPRVLRFPGLPEFLEGVLPDGFEHPVAHPARPRSRRHQ